MVSIAPLSLKSHEAAKMQIGQFNAHLFLKNELLDKYQQAVEETVVIQAREIVALESITQEAAEKRIRTNNNVPKEVTPFMKLMFQVADSNPDLKDILGFLKAHNNNGLKIQAAIRIVQALEDKLPVKTIHAPKPREDDPQDLKDIQNAAAGVLARRKGEAEPDAAADNNAFQQAKDVMKDMMLHYARETALARANQALRDFSVHLLSKVRMPSATRPASKPKTPKT